MTVFRITFSAIIHMAFTSPGGSTRTWDLISHTCVILNHVVESLLVRFVFFHLVDESAQAWKSGFQFFQQKKCATHKRGLMRRQNLCNTLRESFHSLLVDISLQCPKQ